MKKALSIASLLFVLAFLFVGCGNQTPPENTTAATSETTAQTTTSGTEATEQTTEPIVTPPVCEEHQFEDTVLVAPWIQKEGSMERTCKVCGWKELSTLPAKNSIKILAIGNSFSVDAMQYLWDICDSAGIDDVVLGNLYIGGCSLDTHWKNIQGDVAAYQYYINDFGIWTESQKSIRYALESDDWDIITIQQVSQDSGKPETFGNLKAIVDYVNEHKTNENAKIYWHMTWAYQYNSSHFGFANYDKNQTTMYEAIVEAARDHALKTEGISGVIPSGTAIQNLRTSTLGDSLTRDGYHLSYDIGRFTAALTWFQTLTGLDASCVDWTPNSYNTVKQNIELIREAASNAAENPFAVTKSSFRPTIEPPTKADLSESDKKTLANLGLDPENYNLLEWKPTIGAYYNSINSFGIYSSDTSTLSNLPYFIASTILEKDSLPVGSVITVDSGYQYRPEGWASFSSKSTNASRPANVTVKVVIVDDEWWGNYNYRAFNLSYIGSKTVMKESDVEHLRIYVPIDPTKIVEPSSDSKKKMDFYTLSAAGIVNENDVDKYELLDWKPTVAAYYNSINSSALVSSETSTAANIPYYTASAIFERSDLPNGTIILVDNGYQYRPEGWKSLSQNNAASERPGNVTKEAVVINEAWWGSFNHRAFNLSYVGAKTAMKEADSAHLRIYVPKG